MKLSFLVSTALMLAVLGASLAAEISQEDPVPQQVEFEARPKQDVRRNSQGDTTIQKASRQASCLAERIRVRSSIRRAMNANTRLIPGFVRGAFHDCITAIKSKPSSGCNGSLRFKKELDHPGNVRLPLVIDELTKILGSDSCVSYGDALQIGAEVAVGLAGMPVVPGFLGRGRTDSDTPDMDGDTLELPNPLSTFAVQKAFHERKGFNVRELVVSNIGGHALGRFGNSGLRFTPNELVIDNAYAFNLLDGIMNNGTNLPGFNTIPSDRSLVDDEEAIFWLRFYAGRRGTRSLPRLGNIRLKRDFRQFLRKVSKLSGATLP